MILINNTRSDIEKKKPETIITEGLRFFAPIFCLCLPGRFPQQVRL